MSESDALQQWVGDCRSELFTSHENEVFLKMVFLAQHLGYTQVSFGMELPTSAAEPSFSYWSNYPADWVAKFVERHVRHHGSRVAYHKRKSVPAPGRSEYFWSKCDFMREVDAYGVALARPEIVQAKSGAVALIGLSGQVEPLSRLAINQTRILIDMTVAAMSRLLLDKHLPEHHVQISPNERLYMCWVLDGKTASEIATIMNVPEPEVDAMQRALPKRFGKKGIFATSFLAYRMGMLDPEMDAQLCGPPAPAPLEP